MKRTRTQWRNYLDNQFSHAVRARGKCEKCGRTHGVQLQTSHINSRTYKELRWVFLNAFCLCAGCHRWWHNRPLDAADWAREKMGEENYNFLKKKCQTSRQWREEDYLEVERLIKLELRKYE